MTTIQRAGSAGLLVLGCILACGCRQGIDRVPTEAEKVADLRLMLPNQIEIQPFTSVRSFDDDEIPDGILLVLRPVDGFGDPVKAAGHFYFELWTRQMASGEPKGERLALWERDINNETDMRQYWTHAQMFEFQLGWSGQGAGKIQPGRTFVLRAVWRTPWQETVTDEYELDFNLPFSALAGQAMEKPAAGSSGETAQESRE